MGGDFEVCLRFTNAALQTANSDHDGRAIQNLDEALEECPRDRAVLARGILPEYAGIPDSLNSQFLVAHWSKLHAT
jgi:hypothetical protein